MDDGEHDLLDLVAHAFDQRQQQRRFGVKVVIEGAGGDLEDRLRISAIAICS